VIFNPTSPCWRRQLAQIEAASQTTPERKPSEYMDLRFANEAMAELGQK
jgi:hypothetical protein